jgi:hypothetical protein
MDATSKDGLKVELVKEISVEKLIKVIATARGEHIQQNWCVT